MKPNIKPILWKIACQEDVFPGMWQRWFKNQCAAVGWPPKWGWKLDGSGKHNNKGWVAARNALEDMAVGDFVVVALRDYKISRLGQIIGKAITDSEWNPLVPPGPKLPYGEMGRRILVRWDLTLGPDDRDQVVKMPEGRRFTPGELRPTVSRIRSLTLPQVRSVLGDAKNWISLLGKFGYERALSDYIATYPHHLEDGLLPYPYAKIRESVCADGTRIDVLLIDQNERPVVVECKQGAPCLADLKQLRHYMKLLNKKTNQQARGILVHGGSRILSSDVMLEAGKKPTVKVVSYRLRVDFDS